MGNPDGQLGKEFLLDYLKKTDPLFKKYLDTKVREAGKVGELPADLINAFSDIARKGKKIRGSLVVLGYKAAGGRDEEEILDTSLFIELIHSGLLVHDDIQDRDTIRRGLPTIHKKFEEKGRELGLGGESKHYGISVALNAGISAYFLGFDKLLENGFPRRRLVKAARVTADYITRVTHGQALDVSNNIITNKSEDELLNILKYKSAEYTGVLPLLVGAILAGREDEKYLSAIREYGLCLGWAFQIQDDILGAFGDEQKLGKSVGIDIKEGKVTLLMLHLAKQGNSSQKKFLQHVLGNKNITKADVERMQQILKDAGSYDYVVNLGWSYVRRGEKIIPTITDNKKLQAIFRSLLYFMMERTM